MPHSLCVILHFNKLRTSLAKANQIRRKRVTGWYLILEGKNRNIDIGIKNFDLIVQGGEYVRGGRIVGNPFMEIG